MVGIAVDAMSCESGVMTIANACLISLEKNPSLFIHIFGSRDVIESVFNDRLSLYKSRFKLYFSTDVIEHSDNPVSVLRSKKNSSVHCAARLVASGKASAIVSCTNTGALIAISRFYLKMIKGLNKIAILCFFPTLHEEKKVCLLDVGASVDSNCNDLLIFARMARSFNSAIVKNKNPSIAILSNGTEPIKGNLLVKETHDLFIKNDFPNYKGYVEANNLFTGVVDIVVCDGFVGNCVLKASEGVVSVLIQIIKKVFYKNIITKAIGICASFLLKKSLKRFMPSERTGGIILGLNSVVVKAHGKCSSKCFAKAIETAVTGIENSFSKSLYNTDKIEENTRVEELAD